MTAINIVTSICVDGKSAQRDSYYPMTSAKNSEMRRELYWKLVTTCLCSAVRSNPDCEHIVYTNDEDEIIIGKINIREFLQKHNIQIRQLPFKTFKPPEGLSTRFRNAFYKLDVVKALGQLEGSKASILVDSDCLWTGNNERVHSLVQEEKLLLYDIYERKDPHKREPHDLSMADMGKLYRKIDNAYPVPYPVWYGGEFIAGRNSIFKKISHELEYLFNLIVSDKNREELRFSNGQQILDGDEFISSFVYNKTSVEIMNAKTIVKRVWTQNNLNNVRSSDLSIPIWHLPAEKERGLMLLYKQLIANKSDFWKVDKDRFASYLGGYVGIPMRRVENFHYHFKRIPIRVRNFIVKSLGLSSLILWSYPISKGIYA